MNELEEKSIDIVLNMVSSGYLTNDDAKILIKVITQKSMFPLSTPEIKNKYPKYDLITQIQSK